MARVKRWAAQVMIDGRPEYAGSWLTRKDAAIARDRLRLHLGVERGLTDRAAAAALGAATAEELRQESLRRARAGDTTQYTGIYWEPERRRWRIDAYRADRSGYDIVGYHYDEREAALVRDRVMLYIHGDLRLLDFPNEQLEPLSLDEGRELLGYRARTHKSSPYLGVDRRRNRWAAGITFDGERFSLGAFDDEKDAARAYDRAALHLRGTNTKLNFPKESTAPASPEQLRREGRYLRKLDTTSRHVGVSWSREAHAWSVHVYVGTAHVFIGSFDEEEEAALEWDAVTLHLHGESARERLNFPDRATPARSVGDIRAMLWARFKTTTTSSFTGVFYSERTKLYYANIDVDGVHHDLGSYASASKAARAYDRKAVALLGPSAFVNFPARGGLWRTTPRAARRAGGHRA